MLKSLIALMFLFMCQTSKAYDFAVSGINYNILSENERTVEVACLSDSDNDISNVQIPNNVIYNGAKYTIIAIGTKAFLNDEQMKSVMLPYGISEIGDEAFRGCSGLTSLNLPSSITYIGKLAFADCVGLTSITLRSSNIYMGEKAFDNCKNVNHLTIPDDSQIDGMDFLERCGNTSGNIRISKIKSVQSQSTTISNRNQQRQTVSNQSTVNLAQNKNLSRYKGNFKMIGFGYGIDLYDVDGIATYQYRNASDGTRIFEGDFFFEKEAKNQSKIQYQVSGQFKNNKQVGQWKWYHISPIDYRNEITEAIINFDENGVPNGRFDMWIGYGANQRRSWMSGVFENGKIVSVSYKDNSIISLEGRFNSKGSPIGRWNLTGKNVKNRNCIFIFDDYGNQKEAYYIDETTGDKVGVYSDYPKNVYDIVINCVLKHFFRSTPKKIY